MILYNYYKYILFQIKKKQKTNPIVNNIII